MKTIIRTLACWLTGVCLAIAQTTYTVDVAWDPNPEPDLGGYRIYFGQTSNQWTHAKAVGLVSMTTIELPGPGVWFFMLTATNKAALESLPSKVIRYEAPRAPSEVQGGTVRKGTVTQVSTITTVTNIIWVP